MYFESTNQPATMSATDNLLVVGSSTSPLGIASSTIDWEKVLKEVNPPSEKSPDGSNTKVSPTDELTQEILNQYMLAKQSGKPLTDAQKQQIVSTIIKTAQQQGTVTAKVYTASDLTIDSAPTSQSIRAYGNAMGAILQKHLGKESNVAIMQKALEAGDAEGLKGFDIVVDRYRAVATDSKALTVPSDIVSLHLAYINYLEGMATTLKGVEVLYSDPLAAVRNENAFAQYLAELEKTKNQINNYFLSKNIIFAANETGYYLAGSSSQ